MPFGGTGMLQTRPTFSVQRDVPQNNDELRIFMLLDCEEGPLDAQIIRSEYEFKTLYQSEAMTKSYVMALWLLRMGYTLEVCRVHECQNRSSLMLAQEGGFTYVSYPQKEQEALYEPFSNTRTQYTLESVSGIRTFGWSITIPKTGFSSTDYIAITLSSYALTELDQVAWIGITAADDVLALNAVSRNIRLDLRYTPEQLSDARFIAYQISDLLCGYGGLLKGVKVSRNDEEAEYEYSVNQPEENEDGSYTIRLYSIRPRLYATSTFDVLEDDIYNYDMLCRYLVKNKVLTAYSKYDTSLANISVSIASLGETYIDGKPDKTYSLVLNKYDNQGMVILSETYLLKEHFGIQHYNALFAAESKIADLNLYSFDLPVGTFDFGRTTKFTEAQPSDYLKAIDLMTDAANKIDTEFVLDSGVEDPEVIVRLQNSLSYDNVFFTRYNNFIPYGGFIYNGELYIKQPDINIQTETKNMGMITKNTITIYQWSTENGDILYTQINPLISTQATFSVYAAYNINGVTSEIGIVTRTVIQDGKVVKNVMRGPGYNLTSEVFFAGDIVSDNYNLPAYMGFLYKLAQSQTFEGYLDIPYTYKPTINTNELKYQINTLDENNYGIKVENPLAYYNGSEISLEGLVKIVTLLSKIKRKIKSNPAIQTNDLNNIIIEARSEVAQKFHSDTDIEIVRAIVEDRTAILELQAIIDFSYSKKFSLNIKII